MGRGDEDLRGGPVSPRGGLRLRRARGCLGAIALGLCCTFASGSALADLGRDLARVTRALQGQLQVGTLPLRLLERGDIIPVALPPWALDIGRGNCTTLVVLAPVATQLLLRAHPWPGLPGSFVSDAGALQLTRCGRERASLLQLRLELRSPRAVVHTLVAVGDEAPRPLRFTLPERDAHTPAPAGDPGPAPPRPSLASRLTRFAELARESGAISVDTRLLQGAGYVRVALGPGCHRLLVTSEERTEPYDLLVQSDQRESPDRYEASPDGDVAREFCTVQARSVSLSVESAGAPAQRSLALAAFALPTGLPTRFGAQAAEGLLEALGGSSAPGRLGLLVSASLGAQGRTLLSRELLPNHCYLAVVTVLHGQAASLSLGAQAGAAGGESVRRGDEPGPRVGFCTDYTGQADLDVEARGLGVAWLFALFQLGAARVGPT